MAGVETPRASLQGELRFASADSSFLAPHYVVVLKNLKGERDALAEASQEVRARVVPLFESPGRRGKASVEISADTLRRWIDHIRACAGERRPVFLDFPTLTDRHMLRGRKSRVQALAYLFEVADKTGLCGVPVAKIGASREKAHLLSSLTKPGGDGVAVRYPWRALPPPGKTRSDLVCQLLNDMRLAPSDCHLLVDLELLDEDLEISVEDLAAALQSLPDLDKWRSFTLLATSMPPTLGCVREGTLGQIERREWRLWRKVAETKLSRKPSFGDYGIQGPKDPNAGSGPGMRANVRYTLRDCTAIARGKGPVAVVGREQYRELCQWLVDSGNFSGAAFSWGDRIIEQCARGATRPGAQDLWRGAGTSHHLAVVASQLDAPASK